MATIKTTYIIQSCPKCGKQLMKIAAGGQVIGSRLLTCPVCGKTYVTDLRSEWYNYPRKWSVWAITPILTFGMLLAGCFIDNMAMGVMSAAIGFLIGIGITIKDVIRILKSKKRMKDKDYLLKLLMANQLTQYEYDAFLSQAN